MTQPLVIIAGYGPGLGEGLLRTFAQQGFQVAGISRRGVRDSDVSYSGVSDKSFFSVQADLSDPDQTKYAIECIIEQHGLPSIYIHNAAVLHVAPFLETTLKDFESTWRSSVLSAVNGVQAIIPHMLSQGHGSILVSGATAAIRGGANFSAFSSAKFALRGLVQSLAREFQPQGLHVAHVILDGLMRGTSSVQRFGGSDATSIDSIAAAETFLAIARQAKSAWSQEIDLRPFSERF